jgi:hypothetical protein
MLDRLGRSLDHLIDLSHQLLGREVDLVVLDQGIDTSTAVGRMFFQILGAIAVFEHALMSGRTVDGIEAARVRGRTGGQNPSSSGAPAASSSSFRAMSSVDPPRARWGAGRLPRAVGPRPLDRSGRGNRRLLCVLHCSYDRQGAGGDLVGLASADDPG